MNTDVSPELENADSPMSVTPSGMVNWVILPQPEKAEAPIEVVPAGREMEDS